MDELKSLRQQIDAVDIHILQLLGKRIAIMKAIGKIKKEYGNGIRDPQREQEKIKTLEEKAKELEIPPSLISILWQAIFHLSDEIEK